MREDENFKLYMIIDRMQINIDLINLQMKDLEKQIAKIKEDRKTLCTCKPKQSILRKFEYFNLS